MTNAAKLGYSAIREYAERIGEFHGIYDPQGAADVLSLVPTLGGSLAYGDGAEALVVTDKGSFTITLPEMTSARRDRFTIAHELGHYFLHYLYTEETGVAVFGRGERNTAETQANVFAASLLMPTAQFTVAHAELGGDVWALSTRFDVSPAAAEVRCQVLGL